MKKVGNWIMLVSAVLATLCIVPILLYVAFGPADGNPIGLGLLMVFGVPFFAIGALIGLIVRIIAAVRSPV